jgi:hypothetical protein
VKTLPTKKYDILQIMLCSFHNNFNTKRLRMCMTWSPPFYMQTYESQVDYVYISHNHHIETTIIMLELQISLYPYQNDPQSMNLWYPYGVHRFHYRLIICKLNKCTHRNFYFANILLRCKFYYSNAPTWILGW